jgi:hypothetical protein
MPLRRTIRAVATTAAIGAAAAITVLALSGTAGADLSSNQQIQAALPQSPFTAGIPFASGQTIEVKVPPNTLLPRTQNVHILECLAGPGGVPPTGAPVCDNNTQYANTVIPNTNDGSIDIKDFSVFAPPSPALGESASNPLNCGGATNQCILYVGPDQTNIGLPHVWSQGFQVTIKDAGETGTVNPGDGTPEVPLAVGLPLAAAGIVGGTVLFRRRRTARAAA